MKLGICNELFEGWEFSQICEACCRWGYSGLELAPFTLNEYSLTSKTPVGEFSPGWQQQSAADRRLLRQTAASYQLEIIGLHWLLAKTAGLHVTTGDKSIRQKTAAYLGELAGLCAELGGQVMVFGSPHQRSFSAEQTPAQADDNFRHVLELLLPHLERHQIALALEPLGPAETNFMQTAQWARVFIDEFDSPWLRLHLDVKAMSTETIPYQQIIRDNRDILIHFHANDPNRLGPGMGEVDFEPIMAALNESHYQGYLSVEVFDYSPGAETIAQTSVDYLRRFCPK